MTFLVVAWAAVVVLVLGVAWRQARRADESLPENDQEIRGRLRRNTTQSPLHRT